MTRLLALALLAGLLALAGCGEKEDALGPEGSKRLELMLDFTPNADHAPVYAAKERGYFRQAGLDVAIRRPPDTSSPIKQVAAGRVDLAISYEPEVLRARDQGLSVVAVGALVQRPLTSIISLPRARVRRPANLEGKTVGTAGIDYQAAFLRTVALDAGVDPNTIRLRDVGFGLNPALLTRKVDATLGSYWNYEGVQLELERRRPRIIRIEDAGVPDYDELVFVANADALERDGARIRAFVGGVQRGARDVRRDPERGVRALLEAERTLDPRLERAALKVTLPLFFPPSGRPFGWQDPRQWDAFTAWMSDNKLLRRTPDASDAFTNELLPGSAR